ncbi:T9SS type A sorting domain-containing protein [Aurantibacillus circumpalustris]|uniref:T9SS type A sorting domain-containing protein n=1 Tax=Aurantibacillus circumpalustris TaxID=3036359 RepID=UPI00295AE248|nr:T9SS type A sorting domain-containing protein [Aurantibacillus circumpalustris]
MKKIHVFLFFLTGVLNAQEPLITKRTCATPVPDKAWNDWFNAKVEEYKASASVQKNQSTNYTIPVVFHVIHSGQTVGTFPNISQAQINSQISILNNDYAGTGFNVGNFSSTGFSQSLIANCNISFCLAERTPSGTLLTEKGIDRINYVNKGWSNPTTFTTATSFQNFVNNTIKPNTIWDPSRYLNIWISDVNTSVGLLGFATFPPATGLNGISNGLGTYSDDGVWCWSRAIGDVGSLASFYNKGRTATHEIGHYLGLRHLWGDSNCGTDFCDDTPTQQVENSTCPTYPHVTCSNGPKGDLFMNFMDYCYDDCLYMFTNDQRTRIQTAMSSSPLRMQLSASAATLCNTLPTFCSYTVSNFTSTDTLFPYRRVTASTQDLSCPQGSGKAGYLNGTNCYGDKEKAEFIDASRYSNVVDPYVTGVIAVFFQYGNFGTDGTGNVSLNIYSGTTATTQPGTLLGSTTENIATIAATTNTTNVPYCGNPNLLFSQPLIMPYKFNFANPVSVPQYGGFYASLVLPTAAGDTAVVMDDNSVSVNTAWEKWSDNTWHDMKTAWGGVRNFKLAILPIIECAVVGIKENSILKEGIHLFPNPSQGDFIIITNFTSTQNIKVKVYNSMGEIIYTESVNGIKENKIDVNMSEYSNGIYFVEIDNGREKITKKLILLR